MQIDIITLFPSMFVGPFDTSMLKKAQDKHLVKINIHNLRDWSTDKRKTVDDRPYSGGAGMIIKVDVLDNAISSLKNSRTSTKVILLDATGKKFTQKRANDLSKFEHLILIAGHYEGVDYRVHKHLVDEVVSIGDYILTGGEIPAMILTDAIVRLLPGVLEKSDASEVESFSSFFHHPSLIVPKSLLEFPQYTRPESYKGWKVPKVLLSGNHKKIEFWKQTEALKRTKKVRPDLINKTK